ncbi:hypothetical protein V6N11_020021 [Hibiscus sabdariffa]|uniref:Uncharacterized protein n=1 Tax=Hibiscus sabdariffa TaxID=183260 RepID=A0ABR2P964_9ROSI
MDMKKISCTIIVVAASMSTVMAASSLAPAPAPAPSLSPSLSPESALVPGPDSSFATATLPVLGSLIGASVVSFFASYLHHDRRGWVSMAYGSTEFNNFIENGELQEVKLIGVGSCAISPIVYGIDWGHIPFKIFNSWLQVNGCSRFISELLSGLNLENTDLPEKLKLVKSALKAWRTDNAVGCENSINKLEVRIGKLEDELDVIGHNNERIMVLKLCMKQLWVKLRVQEESLKQKSRINGLRYGVSNFAFFDCAIKFRVKKNVIYGPNLREADMCDSKRLKKLVFEYFSGHFRVIAINTALEVFAETDWGMVVHLVVESDTKVVLFWVENHLSRSWQWWETFDNIERLSCSLSGVLFVYAPRT